MGGRRLRPSAAWPDLLSGTRPFSLDESGNAISYYVKIYQIMTSEMSCIVMTILKEYHLA